MNAGATIFAIFSSTSTFSAVLFDSQNYNAFAEAWNSQTGYGNVQYLARSLDVKQVEMEWSVNSAQTLYYVIYCQNILFPMVLYYAYSIEEADNSALYFLMFIAVVAIIVIVIVKKRKAAKTQKIQTQENQTQ